MELSQRAIDSISQHVTQTTSKVEHINTRMNTHDNFFRLLAYKSIDIEARSRRKNLIFHGLAESKNENYKEVLRDFLWNEMGLDLEDFYIERVHRLGYLQKARQRRCRSDPNSPVIRPLIVAFYESPSVETVMETAYMLRNLNGKSSMLEKHVPHKLIKPGQKLDPPWTRSKNVKRARRKRRNAWKNVKSRNLNSDKLLYVQVKQEYKSELNNAKAKYEKELVDSIPENPKRFYNYTRSFTRSSSTVEQLEVNGEKVYDDRGKADCLNSFFSSVLTEESPLRQTLPIKTDRCEKSTRFSPFTEEQVRNKLLKLKPNKSCGPDGIHVNVLRSVPALAVSLCDIFNHSVFSGYVPQDWRDGNITPLHKKGPRKLCSNYRPVTLTSQIVKLLERLDQLLAHVQENNIISCDQHGFQQKCSCVRQFSDTHIRFNCRYFRLLVSNTKLKCISYQLKHMHL